MSDCEKMTFDIGYWRAAHDVCPYCGVDFRVCHPAYNIFPHWTGACRDKES